LDGGPSPGLLGVLILVDLASGSVGLAELQGMRHLRDNYNGAAM
jgi:hypothetical protein